MQVPSNSLIILVIRLASISAKATNFIDFGCHIKLPNCLSWSFWALYVRPPHFWGQKRVIPLMKKHRSTKPHTSEQWPKGKHSFLSKATELPQGELTSMINFLRKQPSSRVCKQQIWNPLITIKVMAYHSNLLNRTF